MKMKMLIGGFMTVGSLFLWMYLTNLGLDLVNASDDFLVALGFFEFAVVNIGFIVFNFWVWRRIVKRGVKQAADQKATESGKSE